MTDSHVPRRGAARRRGAGGSATPKSARRSGLPVGPVRAAAVLAAAVLALGTPAYAGLPGPLSASVVSPTAPVGGAPPPPPIDTAVGIIRGSPHIAPSPASSTSARTRWRPPLGTPFRVSGAYRAPPTPYASGHRGIDLPAVPGTPVVAPTSGEVAFVGRVVDRHVLSMRVDARTVVSFEPLEQTAEALSAGDNVSAGQIIGVAGEGGHCLDECVHLGVRVDGDYVNPLRYFYAKPVLLPW